jgi:hypothetical protein
MTPEAQSLRRLLAENTAAMRAGEITHEVWSERQREIWGKIEAAGPAVLDAVQRHIRGAGPAKAPREALAFAAISWSMLSGGLLRAERQDHDDRGELRLYRAEGRVQAPYPTLADDHLIWLVLDRAAPRELVLTQTFLDNGTIDHDVAPRRRAFLRYAERVAGDAVRSLRTINTPDLSAIDAGGGAWQAAAAAATAAFVACERCLHRLGSNLDCPRCRTTHDRRLGATWDPQRIKAALIALDFDKDDIDLIIAAAHSALAQASATDFLTRDFFESWAARFAASTDFPSEDDRILARDAIEALLIDPTFALPPHAPAQLVLPPDPSDDDLLAQSRALIRSLIREGVPAAEAKRRIQTHTCIRSLTAAIARLYGEDARLMGDLLEPAITVAPQGHPLLVYIASIRGDRIVRAPDLEGRVAAEADEIGRRLHHLRADLVASIKGDKTCYGASSADYGSLIEKAVQRLVKEGGSDGIDRND